MELEYRQATARDEDALVDLWWSMQASHHGYEPRWYADRGEEPCRAFWREHFRRLLQDENAVIVVASVSGAAVGMIVAHFAARPPIYTVSRMAGIDSTIVHPEFRQKGVFRGMLSVLEDKARQAGITVIKLSVHHLNTGARKAYEKSGFAPETVGMIKWIDQESEGGHH